MAKEYIYYATPERTAVWRAVPQSRIADELWEVYTGRGKWEPQEGLSAECEAGLMYGAWNDIVVELVSDNDARLVMVGKDRS